MDKKIQKVDLLIFNPAKQLTQLND